MKLAQVVAHAAVLMTLFLPVISTGQTLQQPVQTEVRLDALISASSSVHAGYGLSIPVGLYIRTGVNAGLGVGKHGADGRLDLIGRFSPDPFRQSRWAPYGGAGLSGRFRNDEDGEHNVFLLIYLGIEGPLPQGRQSGWAPAFELGLGGGARVGVILRRGIHARR